MIKKIEFGKTPLTELHHIFKYTTSDELENKKARLFPSGNADNEVSTISILLASLSAVKEYREELFAEIGITKLKARNANLCAFTELSNTVTGDRPDGLIVITSGMHNPIIEWACFVEAKVKDEQIKEAQIEKYAGFAKEIGINNIITISNHLVTNPKDTPIKIKRRNFNLYHWSWTYLKVTGSRLIRTEKIEDKDHVYILQELRRYFDTHKNLKNYVNMGKDWKDSVNQIHPYSPEQKIEAKLLSNIINSLKQEEKDISLQMTDRTNFHIELLVKEGREEEIEKMLQKSKVVTCNYMLNKDKKNTFTLEIDFIRQKIKCSTNITVNQGKAQAQTSALISMLEDIAATSHVIVNAYYIRKKCNNKNITLAQLIDEKRDGDFYSILDKNLGDEIKFFEVKTEDILGKDFQSVKNFIIKIESIAYRFISQVMANNKKS